MKIKTAVGFVVVAAFTFFSMCAAFTFTEPMCRTPECLPRDGGTDG